MKKVTMTIFIIIAILFTSTQIVYAEDGEWVDKAFNATKEFLNEPLSETDTLNADNGGIVRPILDVFKDIIRSINTILLVVLAWISAISITITGARYILSGSSPTQKEIAGKNLKTAIKGMAIGFGAFIIWRVAIGLILLVVS